MKEVPYYTDRDLGYCFLEDIKKMHGAEFMEKFNNELYGSTCPVIDDDKKPKEYRNNKFNTCYPWDYERFRNRILQGKPTHFD